MQSTNDIKDSNAPHFEIQRIFVKDISFEAPNTPHTFTEEWKPEVSLNLETKSNKIQENLHEVVLSITATVSSNKKQHSSSKFIKQAFSRS